MICDYLLITCTAYVRSLVHTLKLPINSVWEMITNTISPVYSSNMFRIYLKIILILSIHIASVTSIDFDLIF